MKLNYIRKVKELSDNIWTTEFGKSDWEWSFITWWYVLKMYNRNFIPLYSKVNNGDSHNKELVGYVIIVSLKVHSEMDLIKEEYICSSPKLWKRTVGEYVYLSEVILDSDYRNTKCFMQMLSNIFAFCTENNIETVYTSAVTSYSRKLMRNRKISKHVELIGLSHSGREVYKINVFDLGKVLF